ncbi:type VII secretion protein EccCa [Nakamurella sp. GG22]
MILPVARRPSVPGPLLDGPISLAAPPRQSETTPITASLGMVLMPVASGVGAVVLAVTSQGRPIMAAVALLVLAASIAVGVVMLVGARTGERGRTREQRERYLDHLEMVRAEIRLAVVDQRRRAAQRHPEAGRLADHALSPDRLWQCRPADPDFFALRVGVGDVPPARPARLPADAGDPLVRYDPVCLAAATEIAAQHSTVPGQPVVLRWEAGAVACIVGPADTVLGSARAMLLQVVRAHSPDDVGIMVCSSEPQRWEWLKWLPHCHSQRSPDGPMASRLITEDPQVAIDLLESEAADGGIAGVPVGRRLLVIVDHLGTSPEMVAGLEALCEAAEVAGARQLHLLPPDAVVPGSTRIRITAMAGLGGPYLEERTAHGRVETIESTGVSTERRCVLDQVSEPELAALVRFFAPLRPESVSAETASASAAGVVHRTVDVATIDPAVSWQPRPATDEFCAPIGTVQDGSVVLLDLKEASRGGMGPHGLIVGATGSGKSELLRTLVTSLVIGHSPRSLALLVADFKGGATFAGLSELPHLAGMVTNLDADLSLVDRFRAALGGELHRRQELFAAAGGVTSLDDYAAAAPLRPDLEHLPRLLVVVDEFSEMIGARPELIDLFATIGRIGRSIGVHLLLSTQRLDTGRIRGLESHLSYRICLRTFSEAESREAIGVPGAFLLPPEPGWAYLLAGGPARRFRAATVSRPYRPPPTLPTDSDADADADVEPEPGFPRGLVMPFEAQNGLAARVVELRHSRHRSSADQPSVPTPGDTPPTTVLEVAVDRLVAAAHQHPDGRRARQIWLPPLPARLAPDDVPGEPAGREADGQPVPVPRRTPPSAVLGLVDVPERQHQEVLMWDASAGNGNLLIVGAPRSGTSTAVGTLLASLAHRHPPDEVRVACIDAGGGLLTELSALPHVAAVASPSDADLLRRIFATVTAFIDERESVRAPPATAWLQTHLVLIIDGWAGVFDVDPDIGDAIEQILRRGPRHGVHVALTVTAPGEVSSRIAARFGTRIELRLGDPFDSAIDRQRAKGIPVDRPGRALVQGGHLAQIALPFADDRVGVGVADLIERVRERWPGQRAEPIRTLPPTVVLSELRGLAGLDTGRFSGGVLLGLADHDLQPMRHDVLGEDPHLVILGDGGSGKTTALRCLLAQLAETLPGGPRADRRTAEIAVVDHRRGALATDGTGVTRVSTHHKDTAALCSIIGRELSDRMTRTKQAAQTGGSSGGDQPDRQLYLLIDDLDLVATPVANPLHGLLPYLPLGRDLGFHLVVSRRAGGVARAQYGPLLQALGDLGTPVLLLSGSPAEGRLAHGLVPRRLPAGRAQFATRKSGAVLLQTPLPG